MVGSGCCSVDVVSWAIVVKKIQVYKYGHLGASNYNLTTWGVHNKKMHNLNFDVLIQNYYNFKK